MKIDNSIFREIQEVDNPNKCNELINNVGMTNDEYFEILDLLAMKIAGLDDDIELDSQEINEFIKTRNSIDEICRFRTDGFLATCLSEYYNGYDLMEENIPLLEFNEYYYFSSDKYLDYFYNADKYLLSGKGKGEKAKDFIEWLNK